MSGAHGFPAAEYDYEKACEILNRAQRRYELPFLLRINTNMHIPEITDAVETLALPEVIVAKRIVDGLVIAKRNSEEERAYRQALEVLSDKGVYYGQLLSGRFDATVFFASGTTAPDEMQQTLRTSGLYPTHYIPTSGMLVRRADGGYTFLTNKWSHVWPAGLKPVNLNGYLPVVACKLEMLLLMFKRSPISNHHRWQLWALPSAISYARLAKRIFVRDRGLMSLQPLVLSAKR